MKLPLEAITMLRRPHRRTIDQNDLDLLAADMQRVGLLQPIAVRALPDGRYELIAGRRRLAAAAQLGWPEIEAHVIAWAGSADVPALSENVRRTNLSPVEESDVVQALHTDEAWSIAEICERTGHGTSWVQDRLAVAAMPETFKKALHARKVGIGAAMMLLRIEDREYRDYLLHIATINGATAVQAEAWWLDWKARKQLTNPDGGPEVIPQPPPWAPPPPQPCGLCREPVARETIILLRICPACQADVLRAHAEAEAAQITTNGTERRADVEAPAANPRPAS